MAAQRPKRPATGFIIFHRELYNDYKKKFPEHFAKGGKYYRLKLGLFTKEVTMPKYKTLTESDKAKYKAIAAEEFQAKVAAYDAKKETSGVKIKKEE